MKEGLLRKYFLYVTSHTCTHGGYDCAQDLCKIKPTKKSSIGGQGDHEISTLAEELLPGGARGRGGGRGESTFFSWDAVPGRGHAPGMALYARTY